jgi:hypothetical protein
LQIKWGDGSEEGVERLPLKYSENWIFTLAMLVEGGEEITSTCFSDSAQGTEIYLTPNVKTRIG